MDPLPGPFGKSCKSRSDIPRAEKAGHWLCEPVAKRSVELGVWLRAWGLGFKW